jgi:prepilin-type N-terminal cleavage/methylation domain-containing protein
MNGAVSILISRIRRGFTLIELLVVIAIIALLIAILLPAVLLAQRNAYESSTQSTMSTISIALEQYHTDFNMYPPSSAVRTSPIYPSSGLPIPVDAAYDYLAEALLGFEPGSTGGDGAGAAYSSTPVGIQAYKGFSMAGSPKVYGPYVSLTASSITPDAAQAGLYYFADSFPASGTSTAGQSLPILYFTPDMSPAPVGTTVINYNSATTADDIFNTADDSAAPGAGAFSPTAPAGGSSSGQVDGPAFLALLGATNGNATVAGQTILGSNTFLLVSAGADGTYFNGSNIVMSGRQ